MANGNQFGSFGGVSPEGMSAIRNALERRGLGGSVPALDQQSPASASPSPLPADPTTGVAPQAAPGGVEGPPTINEEAKIILTAMKDRLKLLNPIGGSVPSV